MFESSSVTNTIRIVRGILRGWRISQGLGAEDVAKRIGINYSTAARLETGAIDSPISTYWSYLAGMGGDVSDIGFSSPETGEPLARLYLREVQVILEPTCLVRLPSGEGWQEEAAYLLTAPKRYLQQAREHQHERVVVVRHRETFTVVVREAGLLRVYPGRLVETFNSDSSDT